MVILGLLMHTYIHIQEGFKAPLEQSPTSSVSSVTTTTVIHTEHHMTCLIQLGAHG